VAYRHRGGSRVLTRAPRRQTVWFDIPFALVTSAGAGGTLVSSLTAAGKAFRPFTIVRSIIQIWLTSDQAAAAEDQVGAVGIAVVSDQASAIGVTAIPTPVTDMGSELWFAHQIVMGDESALTDVAKPGQQYQINSKAMRKVNEGEDIVIVVENSVVASGMTVFLAGRMLIKAH